METIIKQKGYNHHPLNSSLICKMYNDLSNSNLINAISSHNKMTFKFWCWNIEGFIEDEDLYKFVLDNQPSDKDDSIHRKLYQPTKDNLDDDNPPCGGSGVPNI